MGSESGWPLPSESARLRWLLTVAEGLMFGAGVLFFLSFELAVIAIFVNSPVLTTGMAAIGVVTLFLSVRNLWFTRLTHQPVSETGPRVYRDSAYRDWWETRSWRLVGSIAAIVVTVSITVSLLVVGLEPIGWALLVAPTLWAVCCVGFLIWSYAIYNLRGSLLY